MDRLQFFIAELANKPALQKTFLKAPAETLRNGGVSKRNISLFRDGSLERVSRPVAKELKGLAGNPSAEFLWISPKLRLTRISPSKGTAGSTLVVKVFGTFFPSKISCSLSKGTSRVKGQVLSVSSGASSSMKVKLTLKGSLPPGKYSVMATSGAGKNRQQDTLLDAFRVQAPKS